MTWSIAGWCMIAVGVILAGGEFGDVGMGLMVFGAVAVFVEWKKSIESMDYVNRAKRMIPLGLVLMWIGGAAMSYEMIWGLVPGVVGLAMAAAETMRWGAMRGKARRQGAT